MRGSMFVNVPLSLGDIPDKKVVDPKRLRKLNDLHPSEPLISGSSINCIYNIENFLAKSSLKKMMLNVVVPKECCEGEVHDMEYTSIEQEVWNFNLN